MKEGSTGGWIEKESNLDQDGSCWIYDDAKVYDDAISGSLIALFLGWAGANMITDKMGNTVIDPTSITDSVLMMVWSLFSLFPAAIAFLLMVLSYKFPIKK